jgi:hypothetical protein
MQTEKSWKKQYYDFIENFAKENIDFIRTLPTYKKINHFQEKMILYLVGIISLLIITIIIILNKILFTKKKK